MDGLERLNALSPEQAEADLLECCHSHAWARALTTARPFADGAALLAEAGRVWWSLGAERWLEAFRAHPRIGERTAGVPAASRAARWSEREQAGTRDADAGVLAEFAAANRAYEERFGHVFLICATGRSAEEMLANLRERLRNEPAAELRVAAEEQRKITRIRLERLLSPWAESRRTC